MKKREIIVDGDVAYVPLTQGMFAVIDSEFADEIGKYNWHVGYYPDIEGYYAVTNIRKSNGKWTLLYMHRAIWEFKNGQIPDGLQIDHHEREYTCDNRLINLRLADQREQNQNRGIRSNASEKQSILVGTHWFKPTGKWVSKISYGGRDIYLGYYDTDEEGYKAYCWALLLMGENLPINHQRDYPYELFVDAKTQEFVEKQLLKYDVPITGYKYALPNR